MTSGTAFIVTTSLALLTSACGQIEDEPLDTSSREVFFDGAEIKAIVEEDPNVTFFVDVRDGTINHFNESEESIDFSNFVFQCPSMPAPVPMEGILERLDEEILSQDDWSIQSMQSESDVEFRKVTCPLDCTCECLGTPSNPFDCLILC